VGATLVGSPAVLRIGHRGAAALAPENTLAAMRAAIGAGVDMVEFDVVPGLVVGHDGGHPGPALAAFLGELAEIAPPELGFLVDLKGAGYECATLAVCEAAGVAERCVFSTGDLRSLAALNEHARKSATITPGRFWVPWGRVTPPDVHARSGARDATLRHDIVTAETVAAVHERGGRVFAWTVNTRADIDRMRALGCDGVITDDPRLFYEE
jgi:glycerophosphoryl diester phosphodiesterase